MTPTLANGTAGLMLLLDAFQLSDLSDQLDQFQDQMMELQTSLSHAQAELDVAQTEKKNLEEEKNSKIKQHMLEQEKMKVCIEFCLSFVYKL